MLGPLFFVCGAVGERDLDCGSVLVTYHGLLAAVMLPLVNAVAASRVHPPLKHSGVDTGTMPMPAPKRHIHFCNIFIRGLELLIGLVCQVLVPLDLSCRVPFLLEDQA